MAQENIKINKKLYSRSDITDNIDLSFSELLNIDNRATDVKLKNFFQEYNNLFYDIPKTGNESHSILFQQSRDYINDFYDPKDDQIEALLEMSLIEKLLPTTRRSALLPLLSFNAKVGLFPLKVTSLAISRSLKYFIAILFYLINYILCICYCTSCCSSF